MSDEDRGSDGSGVSPGDAGTPGPAPAPDAGAPDPADADSDDDGDAAEGPDSHRDDSGADATDEGEWRFSLEDLPTDGDEESEGEGIAGAFGPSKEIEPGDIDRESVLFVVLGACIAIVGLYLMFP